MRICIVKPGPLPHHGSNGSCVHLWSLISVMTRRGHDVHVCSYGLSTSPESDEHRGPYRDLAALGVSVHFAEGLSVSVQSTGSVWTNRKDALRRLLLPCEEDFFSDFAYAEGVERVIEAVAPDVVVAWETKAVIATADCRKRGIPRVALLVDLDHLIRKYRQRYANGRRGSARIYSWMDRAALWRLPSLLVRRLAECELVVDHAHHHYEWLRGRGLESSAYEPVAVLDHAGEDQVLAGGEATPLRIILVGKVTGISTLAGLYFFGQEVLPSLERQRGTGAFEVHIIGGGQLPADLAALLHRPSVRLRGYVEDLHAELRSAAVVLVPTPIRLGFRTRISEAFSFGCCVVAHEANAAGMPELRDGYNTLLSRSGPEMAEQLGLCLDDASLRAELGAAGRATFERELEGERVCGRLTERIERLIRDRDSNPLREPLPHRSF